MYMYIFKILFYFMNFKSDSIIYIVCIYKSNTPMTDQLVINYVYFAPNNIPVDKKITECKTTNYM